MKAIQFSHKNAQYIYNDYMHRARQVVKSLSEKDREDCLLEINSHIYEYLEHHKNLEETDALLSVIERLGPPESTLQEVVIHKKMTQAVRTFHPKYVAQALLLNLRNGFIYTILFILFLFIATLPFLIVLKLIYPRNIGLHAGKNMFWFGYASSNYNTAELLGNWFIPVVIAMGISLYFLIIFLLKLKNKK